MPFSTRCAIRRAAATSPVRARASAAPLPGGTTGTGPATTLLAAVGAGVLGIHLTTTF